MSEQGVIGMMDKAYFVPRYELLNWVNQILQLQVEHIEDLGSGAIYCQLLDATFGQMIMMNKVNWKAKFQYQFISNLKIYQQMMQKLNINKKISIQKLSKAKYQDNLQMIQWLKKYIEVNGVVDKNYQPVARRMGQTLYSLFNNKKSFNNNTLKNGKVTTTNKCRKNSTVKIMDKENTPKITDLKNILLSKKTDQQKLQNISKIVFGVENMIKSSVLQNEDQDEIF